MTQVVFLNGPPRSGKDTVVRFLVPYLDFRHLKFAAPLKRGAAGFLDISASTLEHWKEKRPSAFLRNGSIMEYDSVREHLIEYFVWLSYRYGDDILGRLLWQDVRTGAKELCIVSDSGKGNEVAYVVRQVGRGNCIIIRIHRKGCTFEGDNREYLPDTLCKSFDLHNDNTHEQLAAFALRIIARELGVTPIKEAHWAPT